MLFLVAAARPALALLAGALRRAVRFSQLRRPFSAPAHAHGGRYLYPLRPSEPATGECCGNDCRDCVWTQFWDRLQAWEEAAARDALRLEGGADEGQRWMGPHSGKEPALWLSTVLPAARDDSEREEVVASQSAATT